MTALTGLNSRTYAAAADSPRPMGVVPGAAHIALPGGRSYWLAGAIGGTTPRPVIVGLTFTSHDAAWLDSAAWVTGHPETTGWRQHAAANNYTLIFVDPLGGAWNVGRGDSTDPNPNGWPGSGADDETAILAALADAGERTPLDGARTFIAGGSAGGAMAARMSVDHPDTFAACAMAAGWLPYRWPRQPWDCRADSGGNDTTVPIRGGAGINGYIFPPLYEAVVRAPRGSRVAPYLFPGGGHAIPGWWAAAVWNFFTVERLRP